MNLLSTLILSILKMFDSSLGGNKNELKRTRNNINRILSTTFIVLVLSLLVYVGFDLYGKYKPKEDYNCVELKKSFDTLKLQNIKLIVQINDINKKYNNIDIDKFPFKITPEMTIEYKNKLTEFITDIGASRGSISFFHNPITMGYKPIPINGYKTYIYVSIYVSASDGFTIAYDSYLYQNIPLKLFQNWFESYTKKGYVEFDKNSVSSNDKIIFKMLLLDYERVNTAYIFGIPNMGNVKEYGYFVGTFMFDFENDYKLTEEDITKIKIFCEKIGTNLLKHRKQ